MNTLFLMAALVSSSPASADPACKALANYAGAYKLVSKTCDAVFGDELVVRASTDYADVPYVIVSNGFGLGPAVSERSTDSCTVKGDVFTVTSCTSDRNCLPQYWEYAFQGTRLTFDAIGCRAQYVRK